MKSVLFALRVSDLARSLAFYAKVGYVELSTVPFDDGSSLVWLRLPDEASVSLELVHRPADGPVVHGEDGPRTSWLTDPDGYRIELVEWPPSGAPTFD